MVLTGLGKKAKSGENNLPVGRKGGRGVPRFEQGKND